MRTRMRGSAAAEGCAPTHTLFTCAPPPPLPLPHPQVPVGHIPRSMTVQARGEATRGCIPGDHVDVRAGVGGPSVVDSLLVELPGAHAAVIVRAWRRAARIVGLLRALQIFRWLRALQIV